MKRFLWLGTVLVLLAFCAACGDIFRPIIIPNPTQFPNPQAAHTVVTISDNGTAVAGSAMVIDVSGDTDVSQKNVGLRPVHAVQQSAGEMLVVNQSITDVPQDSVTKLNFTGTVIGSTTTITLPTSYDQSGNPSTSKANYVATTESSEAYVSMPQYQPNALGGAFVPSVAVISTTTNSVAAIVPVGTTAAANPVAIAETANGTKLYVANQGDGTISAFNTKDRSSRQICVNGPCPVPYAPTPLSSPPIWLSARTDSQRVYVLEQNGTLAYIDTTSTAGPDTVYESYLPETVQVPGATNMWYDMILNRLYIPQQGQQPPQITIVDVSQSVPNVSGDFGPVTISAVSPTLRSAGDPCATTTAASTLSVAAVTSLPDGSRAYVGSFYLDNLDNVCPQATVINTSNNSAEVPSIPVPGFPDATNPSTPYYVPICAPPAPPAPYRATFRMNMAAGGDSTRAYLASCDGGNVNIIETATESYILNIPAPYSVRPPVGGGTLNPPQNPVFMLAGP